MNLLTGRWVHFKQNLFPILYLAIVNLWWGFNFPPFVRLGMPWGIIVGVIVGIMSSVMTTSVFLFPEFYAPAFNLDHLDHPPVGVPQIPHMKTIMKVWLLFVFHVALFFVWYKDLYGMSDLHYAAWYAHTVIAFALIIRAMEQYKADCNKC